MTDAQREAAREMLKALEGALPHINRLANAKPTTNERLGRAIQARKDQRAIEAAIAAARAAGIKTEGE